MTDKNFEKINIKIAKAYSNVPLYEISDILQSFRLWDQICSKNITDRNKKKKKKLSNHNKHVAM